MKKPKRGAPAGNQNAAKPAAMRVSGDGYSRININVPRKLKNAAVRAAYPGKLTAWIVDAIAKKLAGN